MGCRSSWTAKAIGISVESLRAFGSRRVALQTIDGATFEGRIVQEQVSDRAAVVMFAVENEPNEPLVVTLESIDTVAER